MKSTVGRPRRATDAQVKIILKWHAEYVAWKAKRPAIPTLIELARTLGLSKATVSSIIRRRGEYKQPSPEHRRAEQERRRVRMRQLRRRALHR